MRHARQRTPLLALLLAALLGASDATAAVVGGERDWCGTYREGLVESLAVHYRNLRERTRAQDGFRALSTGGEPAVTAVGEIVAIEDNGSLVTDRSLFDLENTGLRLKSRKKTPTLYKILGLGSAIGPLGDKLPLDDDDSVRVRLPFRFRFFGVKHDSVWVNSDGNLTFGDPDFASIDRDLMRMLNGPPRIAGLFEDFNPEEAPADGGVFVRFPSARKAVFTWYRVPRFGTSNENTFQIEISRNGQIKLRYRQVDSQVGVVGIAPGGGSALNLVDFTGEKGSAFDSAIAERFSDSVTVDEPLVAQTFYSRFADEYSHLVVFTDFPIILGSLGTIAYERNISNNIRGIGLPRFNAGSIYGSSRPLESFVMMGQLSKYEDDVRRNQFIDDLFSGLDVLLHEIAHRWLFFVSVAQEGLTPGQLRGRGGAHWSFYTHSEGSLLEGSFLEPQPNGSFLTTDAPRRYNDFDLYLMGGLPARRVGDLFTVVGTETDKDSRAPAAGETVVGDRVDVPIESLVAAEGERVPEAKDAPKTLRIAVIVLGRAGQPPSAESLDKADRFRTEMEREFRRQSGRELKIDTRLIAVEPAP